jgi:hypothetical protein
MTCGPNHLPSPKCVENGKAKDLLGEGKGRIRSLPWSSGSSPVLAGVVRGLGRFIHVVAGGASSRQWEQEMRRRIPVKEENCLAQWRAQP